MAELLDKIIAEIEPEMAPFVEKDFFTTYRACLADTGRRAVRLNFLRLKALTPQVLLSDGNLTFDKQAAAQHFFQTWPEFVACSAAWEPVPWADDGYFVPAALEAEIGKTAAYKLGLYYLQESSAMLPANLLAVKAPAIVGDFCAAPGGKSGKLAADLQGKSLLLSNDLSNARAHVLLRNLNQLAVWHNTVFNSDIAKLAANLGSFFDAVILDVPCSGEGMLRKDKKALSSRSEKGPAFYHPLQLSLLTEAWSLLKSGGSLVYSTCTFNVQENEAVIYDFLQSVNDCEIAEAAHIAAQTPGLRSAFAYKGLQTLSRGLRIFPQDGYGEGHFAILLKKRVAGTPLALKSSVLDTASEAADLRTAAKDSNKFAKLPVSAENKLAKDAIYREAALKSEIVAVIAAKPSLSIVAGTDKIATKTKDKTQLRRKHKQELKAAYQAADYRNAQYRPDKDKGRKQVATAVLDYATVAKLLDDFLAATLTSAAADTYRKLFARYPHFKLVGESLEWLIDIAALPEHKLHVLSEGLWLGQIKQHKDSFKFIPAHTWALQLCSNESLISVAVDLNSEIYTEYLAGKSFTLDALADYLYVDGRHQNADSLFTAKNSKARYALLVVNGFSAGWLQIIANQVKNCYPGGWISV